MFNYTDETIKVRMFWKIWKCDFQSSIYKSGSFLLLLSICSWSCSAHGWVLSLWGFCLFIDRKSTFLMKYINDNIRNVIFWIPNSWSMYPGEEIPLVNDYVISQRYQSNLSQWRKVSIFHIYCKPAQRTMVYVDPGQVIHR